jgi:hypothetical protein
MPDSFSILILQAVHKNGQAAKIMPIGDNHTLYFSSVLCEEKISKGNFF